MPRAYYRLTDTTDPEERLEDAALAKALHDVLGQSIKILPSEAKMPDHGLHLGRGRMYTEPMTNTMAPAAIPYWKDPAFRAHTSREWDLLDLSSAQARVAELHTSGRDAFVKSTLGAKHYRELVERGTSLADQMDAMIYSFCDRPPCLLVQEAVDMRYERRFLIIDREVLTHSTVANTLTPMSRFMFGGGTVDFDGLHAKTPSAISLSYMPALTRRMLDLAHEVAAESEHESFCLDMCLLGDDPVDGKLELIEYNPMQPGMVGLFGCNPYALATGVQSWLDKRPDILFERANHIDESDDDIRNPIQANPEPDELWTLDV